MKENISEIISKYKMFMSFNGIEYQMIEKVELNKTFKEIERLNNIINELENYIRARVDDNNSCSVCSVMTDDLLNILKGSESNE